MILGLQNSVLWFLRIFLIEATFKIDSQGLFKQQTLIASIENQYLPVATDVL